MNWQNLLQIAPIFILVGFSFLNWLFRRLKQEAERKRIEDERRKRQVDALRTGRSIEQEGNDAPTNQDDRRARLEELAERRRAQLEELRNRQEQQRQAARERSGTLASTPQVRTPAPPQTTRSSSQATAAAAAGAGGAGGAGSTAGAPTPRDIEIARRRAIIEARRRAEMARARQQQRGQQQPPAQQQPQSRPTPQPQVQAQPQAPARPDAPARSADGVRIGALGRAKAESLARAERAKAPRAIVQRLSPVSIADAVRDPEAIRHAIILNELLQPPVSMRSNDDRSPNR